MTKQKQILHHGLCTDQIEVRHIGTDYFAFFHEPCINKQPNYGHCQISKILIDNDGRVIFNLQCLNCGFSDALKTSATLWIPEREEITLKSIFQLSPKLKEYIGHHRWDNY